MELCIHQGDGRTWIRKHKEHTQKAKNQVNQVVGASETVAILWINKDSFNVMGNRNVGHVLYNLLGLKPVKKIQEEIDKNNHNWFMTDNLSLEALPEFDADRLVVIYTASEPGTEDYYKSMQQSGLWESLSAVKNGKVYNVPYEKWWAYTPLTIDALLDEAVALFQK